jgi:phosphate transport system protein
MKHTSHQFEEDLSRLKDTLLLMGGMIESMLSETHEALVNNDAQLAAKIIERDKQLDQLEKKVDELAIEILALRQPTAVDLRFVTASMKICTDLERMGDILVNICERVHDLSKQPPLKPYKDLPQMMKLASIMITKSLDAFVNQSPEMATVVLESDDEVDDLTRLVHQELLEMMKKNPEAIDRAMSLISISKYLERMADHATNIAEQVVFTVKGLDIRHSGKPKPIPE